MRTVASAVALLLTLPALSFADDLERGIQALRENDYDKAVAYFTAHIRTNPKDTPAYTNRGLAYTEKGEYDNAIADFTRSIRLNPKNAVAYNNRGNAHAGKREYARAIGDYTAAIHLDPKDASAFYNRGITYVKRGDDGRATEDFTEALRLQPDFAAAYNNRALAFSKKGAYGKAIADFTASIRLEPKDAYAHNNFAWLLATCRADGVRDGKRAIELATTGCRLTDWKDAGGLRALAAAHAEAGNFKEAVRLERRAIEIGYGDRAEADKARERLKLYQAGKPYRE